MRSTHRFLCFFLLFVWTACRPDVEQTEVSNQESLDSLLIQGVKQSQSLNFDEAHALLNQLIKDAVNQNSPKHQILGYLNLGNLYNYYGLYEESLRFLHTALEISEKEQITEYLNSIYNNLGILYSENKAFDQAEEYFTRALAISRDQNEESRVGMNLINLGITLTMVDDDSTAIEHFNEALNIFEQLDDSVRVGTVRNSLGNIYFEEKEYRKALDQYRVAYETARLDQEQWFRWEYALNMGQTYYKLSELDSAQLYIGESLAGYNESGKDKNLQIKANQIQGDILKAKGQYADAHEYLNRAIAIQDSVLSEKTADWVSQKNLNYELGKKEKELENLEAENERSRFMTALIVFGGLVFVILLVIVAWGRLNRLRQRNLLLEKEKSLSALRLETTRISQEKQAKEFAAQEKLNQLEREKMQQEIDFKNRALVGKAINLANQNEHFNTVQNILRDAVDNEQAQAKAINEALRILRSQENLENEWELFKKHFEEVHPDFFGRLARHNSTLNAGDYRMCAYVILDLSPKEIAQLLNISPDSVRKRRQRLREKLNLSAEDNLNEWLKLTFLPE